MGTKSSRADRPSRRQRRESEEIDKRFISIEEVRKREPIEDSPLVGKTEAQKKYLKAMDSHELIFGIGPAGVGKTYLAAAYAAKQLKEGAVDKVLLTRPAVEAGENLGFLPGELDEKFDPYLQPFKDVLYRRLGHGFTEYLIKDGRIEAVPMAYLRGRTFRNAVVILDEAQNTSPVQMKMFLTRIGENCTTIVNGDPRQTDIKGPSGLDDAISKISYMPCVKIVQFSRSDIVRSGLVQEIVEAYEKD